MSHESTGVNKKPCPACRKQGADTSGDNLVVYPEGRGAHCFACGYHEHGDQAASTKKVAAKLKSVVRGQYRPLSARKIDQRTCQLYGYQLAKFRCNAGSSMAQYNGSTVHVENYWKDGELSAQHIRFQKPKDFRWRGDADINSLPLFGQHLWSGKGKRLIITEGAIDCMTISMLQKNRWPVTSLPSGINSSEASIKANMEFICKYDEVVLCYDNDDVGREYAEKCAELLPAGTAKIAVLPLKDANDMLRANQAAALLQALYEARSFQPDGILHAKDVQPEEAPDGKIWTFPWRCLTETLMGHRARELTMWTSGTGSGKSTVMRELAFDHLIHGRKVGMLMLEESPSETLDDMISLLINKPVRQIRAGRQLNALIASEGGDPIEFPYADTLTEEEYQEARRWFEDSGLYIYDHHGANEFGNVISRAEYMAAALQCEVIIIDHVTAVVAGMEKNGSERECLDQIMKSFRSLVERTDVHLDVVTHLNRLTGTAAEEGGRITLNNLRGSGSLGSVPNSVLAIERDQQADDPEERSIIKVRSLKGRFLGVTGIAGLLKFDHSTRRLVAAEWQTPQGDSNEFTDESGLESEGEPGPDAGDLLADTA